MALGVFLLAFVAFNLVTLERIPFVSADEVYFVDPALNLVNGQGFVSRVWDYTSDTRPLASTSPLYSLLLAGWASVFGEGLVVIRTFGVLLAAVALATLYAACRRWEFRVSNGWLLMMCGAIALMYGFSVTYRSARPEPMNMLLASAIFYFSGSSRGIMRYGATFVLACALPFAGQVLCLAIGIFIGLAALTWPERCLRPALAVMTGMVVGTAAFIGTYHYLGILGDFLEAVNNQGGTPLERLIHRLTTNPLLLHRNAIPKDFSLVPLAASLGAMLFAHWRHGKLRWKSSLTFAFCYAVILSPALFLLGKFPTYYSWLLFLPVAVVVCTGLSEQERERGRPLWLHRALLLAACMVGHPVHLLSAIPDWESRDYHDLEVWAGTVLNPDDVAFVNYGFFYAARAHASKVYLYGYGKQLREEDIRSITVLILSPHATYGLPRDDLMQKFGPDWVATGESRRGKPSFFGNDLQLGFLSAANYDGDVYRRAGDSRESGR